MKPLLILVFCARLTFATTGQGTTWEIRKTGNDTNGGAFDSTLTSAGTDLSIFDNKNAAGCSSCQSASVNISVTDGVTNGTATITSATANFSALLIGNSIYVTGGTGAVAARRYEVTAVGSSTSITVDSSSGLTAGTGVTINIGGALLTPGAPVALLGSSSQNTVWIQAGTYTLATTVALVGNSKHYHGYQTTRGDQTGTRPLITTATNSTNLFSTSGAGGQSFSWTNLSFSNTASTRAFALSSGGGFWYVVDCKFDGFTTAISAAASALGSLHIDFTEVQNSTVGGIVYRTGTDQIIVTNSYIHNNTGIGIAYNSSGGAILLNNIIVDNTGDGFNTAQPTDVVLLIGNTFANNGGDGAEINTDDAAFMTISKNIFWGNTGFGLTKATVGTNKTPGQALYFNQNAYGGNGTDVPNYIGSGNNPITILVSPFKSATDYSLNGAPTGGALLKSIPTTIPGSTGINFVDLGAIQGIGGSTIGIPTQQ